MNPYSKRRGSVAEVGTVRRTGPIRPHERALIEAVEEWARVEVAERGALPDATIVVHLAGGVDVEVAPRRRAPEPGDEPDPTETRFKNMELE